MSTIRVRILVMFALAGAFLGAVRSQPATLLLSLSVCCWVFIEWLRFCLAVNWLIPRITAGRSFNEAPRAPTVLRVGRPVKVRTVLTAPGARLPGLMKVTDWLPEIVRVTGGSNQLTLIESHRASNRADRPDSFAAEMQYDLVPRAAGSVVLHGCSIFLSDPCGFFRCERFIECRDEFRIIPVATGEHDSAAVVKRLNFMPQHGVHRLQAPGLGSELLDLREYQPGDSPRTIAWKASARRDRLMVRQYESEVPIRMTILLDAGRHCLLGGFGRRYIDTEIRIAADVAASSIGCGDAVGLTIVGTDTSQSRSRLRPAFGERQYRRILDRLADAAVTRQPLPRTLTPELLDMTWNVCSIRYPQLLDPRINKAPWTLFPLSAEARAANDRRFRLAMLFAALFDLPLGDVHQLVTDDIRMAVSAQWLLTREGYSWLEPVSEVHPATHAESRLVTSGLVRALRQVIQSARDNEVIVLLADLVSFESELEDLLPAIRLARAGHHHVSIVCPQPSPPQTTDETLFAEIVHSDRERRAASADRVRRILRRTGASVAMAADRSVVARILSEADLVRAGRTARAGSGHGAARSSSGAVS